MRPGALAVLLGSFLWGCPAAAQMADEFHELYIVRVKPERRAEFDALARKIGEANRKHKGDTWLAFETIYGDQNTVYFLSRRKNYAGLDESFEVFNRALNQAFGKEGAAKLLQSFKNCLVGSRGELRRARWDLSRNLPSDPADLDRVIGQAKYIRITEIHVRPGRGPDFEATFKTLKQAAENSTPRVMTLASQSVAGQDGTVYYFTSVRPSLGGYDVSGRSWREVLGADSFKEYMKTVTEYEISSETDIHRFVPGLSNPPEEIVAASPAFWRPPVVQPVRPQ